MSKNSSSLIEHTSDGTSNSASNLPRYSNYSEGFTFPVRVVSLTRGDLVNYAGVSGDTNPIHYSDYLAKMMGLEDVCAHGMLSLGIATSILTEWLGDPRAIKDIHIRFTSPFYVPYDTAGKVEFIGKCKSMNDQKKTGIIHLTARQDARRIFGKASSTVQFQ